MLRHLPTQRDPNVLVGFETGDDAAVYRLSAEQALVQTLDLITPVVDDPRAFGRIAAANALSDIYAMGARPFMALNILAVPRGRIPWEVVGEIVGGGAEKAREAGVAIAGGHSLDDPEPKYGLVASGLIHPDRIVRNSTARPGDALVLTKPLGMGIITTGAKQRRASAGTVAEAVAIMETLNHAASAAMLETGVSAATDVTGFGLLGHLREMVAAAGVAARVRLGAVPVLEEAWALAREGVVPAGTHRNRRSLSGIVEWIGVDEVAQLVLCDAQTSGGLLLSVPQERVDVLQQRLRSGGVAAALIGEVTGGVPGTISVIR